MPPSVTVRQTPAGIKLGDGYRSVIAFERDPDVSFWERSVKPSGVDGGDPIDTSTMHNTTYRTKSSRALKDRTDMTVKAGYDPNLINQAIALVNAEGAITQYFPDGTTDSNFGYLRSIEFDDLVEGTFPECTITITITNTDPTTGAEAASVLTSVAGT